MELTRKSSWMILRKTKTNFGDQGTNIRLSKLEIVEIEDPQPPRKRGRRSVTNNFSEIEWSKNVDAFTNYKFEENTSPSTVMSAEKVAVDFFLLLVTNRMLTEIVNETNRYVRQSLQAQGKNPSDWDKKQVTLVKMKAWLGLIMAMSIHKLPAIVDYWKDDWILGVPAFSSIMLRNRFQEILRYLHLNDNETMPQRDQDNYDKLYKVRPFIENLKINFQIQYHPHCEQSIDEAMVKYKGRTVLKQYMPMEPIKRGMKLWCRADCHSGYLCDFNVYCGKDKGGLDNGLGYAVVTDSCQSIYGKYHKIYFDNFFTSLDLIKDLYSNKTLSCGTVRAGRKNFPKELFNKETTKNMARGDMDWRAKGPTSIVVWMDKKPVCVAGTIDGAPNENISTVKRRKKDGVQSDVPCPEIVNQYNQFMGGVDRND